MDRQCLQKVYKTKAITFGKFKQFQTAQEKMEEKNGWKYQINDLKIHTAYI